MTLKETYNAEVLQERAGSDHAKIQQRSLAFYVGCVALALPLLLYVGSKGFFLDVETLKGCEKYTLSHFYYSPVWGSFFIGMLAFIGAYMTSYSSKDKDEKWLAKIGGLCAFGVALIPAKNHGCLSDGEFRARAFAHFKVDEIGEATLLTSKELSDRNIDHGFFDLSDLKIPLSNIGFPQDVSVSQLHYVFALILFAVLGYFCFVIFTRSKAYHKQGNKIEAKKTNIKTIRNTIYIFCGCLIVLSMAMLGNQFFRGDERINSEWNRTGQTFLWETVALVAFGISWLTKGRFYEKIVDLKGWLFRMMGLS